MPKYVGLPLNSGGGVGKYTELDDRPNQLLLETPIPATSTGGEFIPTVANNSLASVTENGSTIATARTGTGWGGSGTFSAENIPADADGYVSFKNAINNKNYMVGLSRLSDATSSTYTTIDYAIFIITKDRVQIYENNANRGDFTFTGSLDDIYKVEKTGTVIKYYRGTSLIYTSTVAVTEALYLDTAFKSTGSVITNIRMLNSPLVITPAWTKYEMDINSEFVIGFHIDELVSDTDFADVLVALTDDAVKKAVAGDFVLVAGRIYHVIRTHPTLAAHLLPNAVNVEEATDAEVEVGTGTDPRIFTPKQIDDKVEASVADKATTAEMIAGTETNVRGMSPKLIKDEVDKLIGEIPSASASDVTARTSTTSGTISVKQVSDVAEALISEIPATPSGGGVADSVPWGDITEFPEMLNVTKSPAVVASDLNNSYAEGVSFNSTNTEIKATLNGWGTAGAWDDNPIMGDGFISARSISTQNQSRQIFGLTDKESEADAHNEGPQHQNYAWFIQNDTLHAWCRQLNSAGTDGQNTFDSGVYTADTVFKIQRIGTTVTYLRDDVVVHTSNTPSTGNLHFDISIGKVNGTFADMKIQGQADAGLTAETTLDYSSDEVINKPTLVTTYKGLLERPELIKENSSGTWYISWADITGTPDFRSNGIVGAFSYLDLKDAPPIIRRTVTEEVSTGGELIPTFDTGARVGKVGVTITDNGSTITSTASDSWNNSGVFSDQVIPANTDGYVSFEVVTNNKSYMVGLNQDSTTPNLSYVDILYALYIKNNEVEVYESGQLKGTFPDIYEDGSFYKVKRTGLVVTYLKDDVVFYTSSRHEAGELRLEASFLHNGSIIKQVRILNAPLVITTPRSARYAINYEDLDNKPTSADSVAFENITALPSFFGQGGVETGLINPQFDNSNRIGATSTITETGSTVTSTHTTYAWGNSGAFSSEFMLGSGTGYVSFKVTSLTKRYMVGLSTIADASSVHYNTIDYAIYISSNAMNIYRNGSQVKLGNIIVGTSVATGDIFSVKITNGVVTFTKNSTDIPTDPQRADTTKQYHVDVALLSRGATITDIKFLANIPTSVINYLDPNVINKPKYLQEVRRSYSAEKNMTMAGATSYNIPELEITMIPKSTTSKLLVSFDIKACAPLGHIFSFSIYINDSKVNEGGITVHNVDGVVPVPTTSGGESLLHSVVGSVETTHPANLASVSIRVYAWYHKDGDATLPSAILTLNRAKSNIKGLAYKLQGTSIMEVEEIEV